MMDIDIVYTWVNSNDRAWKEKRVAYAGEEVGEDFAYRAGEARFRDNDELRYSLRSVERYLPFVRKIFIAHAGAAPDWLKKDSDDLVFVPQERILPPQCSPSYSSNAIESCLYKIPNLSEYYIYANDDTFFCTEHDKEDIFDKSGRACVSINKCLLGRGEELPEVFRSMELRSGRAMQKKIKLPKPVTVNYPYLPISIRCLLKGCLPINTISHVAQPFRKSIWQEFHKIFSEEIENLYKYRFRSKDDVAVNLMAHHYALSVGKAVFNLQDFDGYLGRTASLEYRESFTRNLFEKSKKIKCFCLNDEPSEDDDGWNDYTYYILNRFFPEPSRWEV